MRGIRLLLRTSLILFFASLIQPLLPGQTFGESAGAATKGNLDLPFDTLADEEPGEEPLPIVSLYGQQFEADGIFFCLDRSASMRNGGLAIEKRETIRNIMEFSEKVQFAVIYYDAGVVAFPPVPGVRGCSHAPPQPAGPGEPATATPEGKAAAVSFVSAVQAGAGTCAGRGLQVALNFANTSTAKRNAIIYVGDGRNTCPGTDPTAYEKKVLADVTSQNFKGVQIHAILVAGSFSSRLVRDWFPRQLAAHNNGTYTRIDVYR